MMLKIYSMFDSAAKAYSAPFTVRTNGEALRVFYDAMSNPTLHQLRAHAEQFWLVELGQFDELTGDIQGVTDGHIIYGVSVKEQWEANQEVSK